MTIIMVFVNDRKKAAQSSQFFRILSADGDQAVYWIHAISLVQADRALFSVWVVLRKCENNLIAVYLSLMNMPRDWCTTREGSGVHWYLTEPAWLDRTMKKKVLSSCNTSGRVRTGCVTERERINSPTALPSSLCILFITFKIPNP